MIAAETIYCVTCLSQCFREAKALIVKAHRTGEIVDVQELSNVVTLSSQVVVNQERALNPEYFPQILGRVASALNIVFVAQARGLDNNGAFSNRFNQRVQQIMRANPELRLPIMSLLMNGD